MPHRRLISPLVLLCFVLAGWNAAPTRAQRDDEARSRLLVSPAWLAAHLEDKDLVLLHVGNSAPYRTGHIPGAQSARAWRNKPSDADGFNEMGANDLTLEMLPDADLPAILARHGITQRSRIVVYFGATEYTSATRLMLALTHAGLGDRTSLLQGGMPAWQAAGHPITTEVPVVTPSVPGSLKTRQVTVDAAFVQVKSGTRGFALVDTREPAVYDGVPGANKSAPEQGLGHLPHALNIANEMVVDEARNFLPATELRAIFAKAGVKPGDTLITYCYTGQRATAVMLAAETLGYKTLLYDGSAEDWSARKLPFTVKTAGKRDPAK